MTGPTDSVPFEFWKPILGHPEKLCHRATRGGVMVRSLRDRCMVSQGGGQRPVESRFYAAVFGACFPIKAKVLRHFGACVPTLPEHLIALSLALPVKL